MNDGGADPTGAFWAGTKDVTGREPIGSLYRVDTVGAHAKGRSGVHRVERDRVDLRRGDDVPHRQPDPCRSTSSITTPGPARSRRAAASSISPGRGVCPTACLSTWRARSGSPSGGRRRATLAPDGTLDATVTVPVSAGHELRLRWTRRRRPLRDDGPGGTHRRGATRPAARGRPIPCATGGPWTAVGSVRRLIRRSRGPGGVGPLSSVAEL